LLPSWSAGNRVVRKAITTSIYPQSATDKP
jgi:hypothetical protein